MTGQLNGHDAPGNGRGGTSAFWMDRPTLVTGATGLVGGWLVDRLVGGGADVVTIVRDQVPASYFNRSPVAAVVTVVGGDVTDQTLLERVLGEYEIDTVIHLAAQTIVGVANRNPVSTFQSNIAGTWALLEAVRRSPTVRQVVLASSDKAYGESRDLPYTEDTPLRAGHPYDVSKAAGDLIAQSYAITYGTPVAITRCGNFYGGGDLNWNRIVPGTIRSIVRGERPVIRSDGTYLRDYFFVEDGVEAYMLLAERLAADRSLAGAAFNFSNEESVTVLELVSRISRLMESTLEPVVLNGALSEIREQRLSASRAREQLGWRPGFSLDEGLTATIDWYREFFAERVEARV